MFDFVSQILKEEEKKYNGLDCPECDYVNSIQWGGRARMDFKINCPKCNYSFVKVN